MESMPPASARRSAATFLLFATALSASGWGCASPHAPEPAAAPVWPGPPDQPRIRFLRSYQFDQDVAEERSTFSQFVDYIGGELKPVGLKKPYAVFADAKGRIYVGDTGWGRVLRFDPEGHRFDVLGESGDGELARPAGIAGDGQGKIYVADGARHRVVVFDGEGEFVRAYGGEEELAKPSGIALSTDGGQLYVVDTGKHEIAVFNVQDGARQTTVGKRGSGDGELNFPTHLVVDSAGNLNVVDTFNFRIQVFSPDGKLLRSFGRNCNGPGCMPRAKGIGIDSEGNVYVADAAFNLVQVFDTKGELLLAFGGGGRDPGHLALPAGLYIDARDRIYVADSYNYRINVYQFLSEAALRQPEPQPAEATEPPQPEPPPADPPPTPAEQPTEATPSRAGANPFPCHPLLFAPL